jgi:transcription termination/antitermination protein NusA
MVVSELRGEKIDIIPFNEEPARFVAKALSPARVREVLVDDEAKQATVIVPDDQLSLAIGKDGLNARLAARLTGWRVDIRSETEFAAEEAEMGFEEEEVSGRCAAILANGKRCPNASLPGSRYCGIPAHQGLEEKDTDYVVPPEEGGNGEPEAEEPAGEPSAEEVLEAEPSVGEVLEAEPSVEEVLESEPSVDEVVETEPSVDEVVEAEPSVGEVVEAEPSVDEVVEAEPSADGAGSAEPSRDEDGAGESTTDDAAAGQSSLEEETAEADASGSEEAKQS